MTISDSEKKSLIEYRIKQAFETAEVAELLFHTKLYPTALNRIYYSVFYCMLALAIQLNYKTSKHAQLLGWFNRNFIATGKIEREYGKIVRDCYEFRLSADYDSFVNFAIEDVAVLLKEMKSFLYRIELYIKENE
jgi:uncharacterized protein (UPF0332 family)